MSPKYDHMIQKKQEVEDQGRTKSFSDRPERPARLENRTIFLAGLPGSGRRPVGEKLAGMLERPFIDLAGELGDQAPEMDRLEDILAEETVVASLPAGALDSPRMREALKSRGKVFYLMASVPTMAARLGAHGPDRESLADRMLEMEPLLMETMHFILPADRGEGEIASDAAEKAAL